jgi:haloalkane dehalogenase
LSDKPKDADYHPRLLSEDLTALLDHLELDDVTLVAHDFGGPIALGHALRRPQNVGRLVLFNTWMWSLEDHAGALAVDRAVRGPFGHALYIWLNGSARWLVPRVLDSHSELDPEVHRHYLDATSRGSERFGQLGIARSLIGASEWYAALWDRRAALEHMPVQLIWGMNDPTFGPSELERWCALFPDASVTRLEAIGHFPQEEAPGPSLDALRAFVGSARSLRGSASPKGEARRGSFHQDNEARSEDRAW